MKKLFIIVGLIFSMVGLSGFAMAEDKPQGTIEKIIKETDKDSKNAESKKDVPPGEYECKYYTVKLPEGWITVLPPTDHVSTVNAIFSTTSGSSVVTLIIGNSGGADAQTIAEMFAEQFKAVKPPVNKNGQYTFYFPLQNANAEAIITTQGDEFMVTTIAGNAREARSFLKDAIKSEKWSGLFPK